MRLVVIHFLFYPLLLFPTVLFATPQRCEHLSSLTIDPQYLSVRNYMPVYFVLPKPSFFSRQRVLLRI